MFTKLCGRSLPAAGILLVFAIAVSPTIVLGQNGDQPFAELDGNGDGVLSGSEASGSLGYDADGNGEVTQDEFRSGREREARRKPTRKTANRQQAAEQFRALDRNEDGRLSGTEMRDREALDANRDQRITLEEFVAGMTADEENEADGGEGVMVVVSGVEPFDVQQNERVRLTGNGIAGSNIRIQVTGPAKVERSNYIRPIIDGETPIGGLDKEFEIRPTGKGEVSVVITVEYPNTETPGITKYRFTVR